MALTSIIRKLKQHAGKITIGAFLVGTLAVNPDYYFSECAVGARDVTDIPYTHRFRAIHQPGSREFIREHEKVWEIIMADRNYGNDDGRVSYSEAIEWLYRRYTSRKQTEKTLEEMQKQEEKTLEEEFFQRIQGKGKGR